MDTTPATKHSFLETTVLHLVPGILIALTTFVLAYLFRGAGIPALFFLQVSVVLVLLPFVLATLSNYRKKEKLAKITQLFTYNKSLRWYEYLGFVLFIVAFAAIVLTLFGTHINPLIKTSLFSWLPPWLDITDIFYNPQHYSHEWFVGVWIIGIVVTTIGGPLVEELYFRGFLLPRIPGNAIVVVVLGIVLFSVYHFFSPWMTPARIVALIPLVFFVYYRRNITLGIAAHILLNLAGDTISTIPMVFSP